MRSLIRVFPSLMVHAQCLLLLQLPRIHTERGPFINNSLTGRKLEAGTHPPFANFGRAVATERRCPGVHRTDRSAPSWTAQQCMGPTRILPDLAKCIGLDASENARRLVVMKLACRCGRVGVRADVIWNDVQGNNGNMHSHNRLTRGCRST